jgi:kinesin family protein 3/17
LLFQETAMPIVESVCEGYNGTIFAYGQTGTGKTYTMEGDFLTEVNKGIIPRSFDMIFSLIKGTYNTNYLIRCSYLELYNEEVRDLLSKQHKQRLDIREDVENGFYVQDLSQWVCKTPADMVELMMRGRELKVIKGHNMNERSSRSHCIFTIIVENSTTDEKGGEHIRKGKLNLVDLAGSERTSKIKEETGAVGGLQKETIHINLSLTALGKVICALVSSKKQHIPYRDSKLTKLLMDSLGGNSKTVMIANIGPADYNYEETVTTLRYADRAKNIKNAPKINEDPKDAMIRQYQEELAKLKRALAEANGGVIPNMSDLVGDNTINPENRKRIQDLEQQFLQDKEKILKSNEEEKRKIEESKNLVEAEKYKLLEDLKKKQAQQEEANKEREKIMEQLRKVEDQFVLGQENQKKAKENEIKLKKARQELEERDRKRQELQNQIKANEEEIITLEKNFKDQDSEIEAKTKVFKSYKKRMGKLELEKKDIEQEYEDRNNEFMERQDQLQKEIDQKKKIINTFIPKKYLKIIKNLIDYDQKREEWYMPDEIENIPSSQGMYNVVSGYDEYYNGNEDDYDYEFENGENAHVEDMYNNNKGEKNIYYYYERYIKPRKKKVGIDYNNYYEG